MKERLRKILEQEAEEPMCEDQDEKPGNGHSGVVIGDIKGTNITVTINCNVEPSGRESGPQGGIWRSLQSQISRRFGASRIRNDHLVSNRLTPQPQSTSGRKPAEILVFRPPQGVG
jgi:hypothetical protein